MTTADQPTGYFNTTYAIEFTVNGTLDGTTVGPAILDSPPTGVNVADPQRLFRREVTDLGLIDPDYQVPEQEDARRGTKGNRLVTYVWLEGPAAAVAGASVDVVDAVDGTAIVQKNVGTFVGDTKFFREGIFMPQGSMLRVRGLSAAGGTPVKVRLHIQYLNNARDLAAALEAICCIESENGNDEAADLELMVGPPDFRGNAPGVESLVVGRDIGGLDFNAFRMSPDPGPPLSTARFSFTLPRRRAPVGRYSITVTLEYSDVEPAPSFAGLLGIGLADQPDDLSAVVFPAATDIQVQSVGNDPGPLLSVLEWEFSNPLGQPFVACVLTQPANPPFAGIIYLYQATLRFLGA